MMFGKGLPLTAEQRAVHGIRADETLALHARIAELELAAKWEGDLAQQALDDLKKRDTRIAELEDGLSSACEYAEKYEAALKRLYDAALDIDVNEMSSTERDWWQTELRAARAAYLGEKE